MRQLFCLGSYTEDILFGTGEVFHGKGEGVTICAFEDGKIETLSALSVPNPSFVCVREEARTIYAVNEGKEFHGAFGGGVTEIRYEDDFAMHVVSDFPTKGTDPCHLSVSPDGKILAVVNFASGSVTAFPLSGEAHIYPDRQFFQHEGKSVHPVRQQGPHAHSCLFTPDGHYLLVPDLGLDTVKIYAYENGTLYPCPEKDVRTLAGAGPRAGVFSADGSFFYLINEIASSVSQYRYADGTLTHVRTYGTLPEDFTGDNICSDLHLTPDGRFLYASNRGHDSLTIFRTDADGSLSFAGRVSCGGRTPRNFAIDPEGRFLLCGNQDTDMIVVFAIGKDGALEPTGSYAFGSPVCIRFFAE